MAADDPSQGPPLCCCCAQDPDEGERYERIDPAQQIYERGDTTTHVYRIGKTIVLFLSWICLVRYH